MCCCVDDPKEAIAENLFNRSEDFKARRAKQIQTPDFPTTTIGSFPQTPGNTLGSLAALLSRGAHGSAIPVQMHTQVLLQRCRC